MTTDTVRVRFAPSPTGFMHLGNVRAALMNFIFARQRQGTFIVRIEDTDQERNVDRAAKQLLADLAWLDLTYDEGPGKGGPYGPYFQSERDALYQQYLLELKNKGVVYPCFCTAEELEKKRERQIAMKLPPRYDRSCLRLTELERQDRLTLKVPFIWRFQLDNSHVEIYDLRHGTQTYDLAHFSDFALTRQDGSFTFIFANFVDDLAMHITHVIRGEDHLTNTALQAALYRAFNHAPPIFWHLPIICNSEGKKLSKRDFGFSLTDLRTGGFLSEAIVNYLGIIGGSFTQEILSVPELCAAFNVENMAATSHIRYDVDKLRWVNHKWIMRLPPTLLFDRIRPYIHHAYAETNTMHHETLTQLVALVQPELVTLQDSVPALAFYFKKPVITHENCKQVSPVFADVLRQTMTSQTGPFVPERFLSHLQQLGKEQGISSQQLFEAIRFALTGSFKGPRIKELLSILSEHEIYQRFENYLLVAQGKHEFLDRF